MSRWRCGSAASVSTWRRRCSPLQPTAEHEPPPDQRLPPRETRTELRRTAARAPPLHGQTDALEIERSHPTLELLPTNADQDLPTPSGPTDLKKLSHTFLLRELLQGGRAAWQRWTRRRTQDARRPEGVVYLTLSLSEAKWQGAFQWLQQACQPVGLKGGWRDCCIVIAPERSGLGTLELLRALVSQRAFDDAKRERVGRGEMLVSGLAFVVAKRWDVGSRCDIRIAQGEQPA